MCDRCEYCERLPRDGWLCGICRSCVKCCEGHERADYERLDLEAIWRDGFDPTDAEDDSHPYFWDR